MSTLDDARVVLVGRDALPERDLVALSRAATVVGPSELIAAVRHLCPPTTKLVVVDTPGDVRRPVVLLRSQASGREGRETAC